MGMGIVMAGAGARALSAIMEGIVGSDWTPLATASLFLPIGVLCLFLLDMAPPPSAHDIQVRM